MNAEELKMGRFKTGLSQWALAVKAGVSRYRLGLFEAGYLESLKPEELERISKVLAEEQSHELVLEREAPS